MSGWKVTYMGDGVRSLEGVGVFQRHTTASVTEEIATSLRGDTNWQVLGPQGGRTTVSAPPPPAKPEPAPAAKAPEPKKDEPKAEAKKDEPKAPEAKKDEPKKDEPKAEAKAEAKKDEGK